MRKFLFCLIGCFFLFSTTLGNLTFHQNQDSARHYYLKYKSTDTSNLKVRYLKKAAEFYPVDSYYVFLAQIYLREFAAASISQYYALKSMNCSIQTKINDYSKLDIYLDALSIARQENKALKIYSNKHNKTDSVFYLGKYYFSPNISHHIDRINFDKKYIQDSISIWDHIKRNAGNYAFVALRYYDIGQHWKAHKIFKQGLKKYPESPYLYLKQGKVFIWEGKVDKAISYFEKAQKLGLDEASIYIKSAKELKEATADK